MTDEQLQEILLRLSKQVLALTEIAVNTNAALTVQSHLLKDMLEPCSICEIHPATCASTQVKGNTTVERTHCDRCRAIALSAIKDEKSWEDRADEFEDFPNIALIRVLITYCDLTEQTVPSKVQ